MAMGSLLLTALTGKAAGSRTTGGGAMRYGPPLAKGTGGTDVPARRFPRGAERHEKLSERQGGLTGFGEGRRKRQGGQGVGGVGGAKARKGTAAGPSP